MGKPRRYQLLCPIARALDRIGDRWTLLILRDLHGGPARFSDLQSGFKGLASNLLTDRLRQLEADGLVERRQEAYGVTVYALTFFGGKTGTILYELAAYGMQFPPEPVLKRPGNLRTMVVTLREAIQRVVRPDDDLHAELVVDGEPFTMVIKQCRVEVAYQGSKDPEVSVISSYEPMMAVGDGRLSPDQFAAEHLTINAGAPEKAEALLNLLGKAMAHMRAAYGD